MTTKSQVQFRADTSHKLSWAWLSSLPQAGLEILKENVRTKVPVLSSKLNSGIE